MSSIVNSLSPTGWVVSAAFNAGLAYYLRKRHPRWALFFAFNAATAAIFATQSTGAGSAAGLVAPLNLPGASAPYNPYTNPGGYHTTPGVIS